MNPLHDHERPLLLVLGSGDHPADAVEALLGHPDVTCHNFPPPWSLDQAGVDLPATLPELRTITLENLREVLDALIRICTPERLQQTALQLWREVDDRVRAFYLERGALDTFATIFKMKPRSEDLPPPPGFVEERIYQHGFATEYRLRREGAAASPLAPPEEGSLVVYPFDPSNPTARRESDLGEGPGPVMEAFGYAEGRERHKKVLEELAYSRGWRVIDPE